MSTVPFITKRNRKYSLDAILNEVCDIYKISPELVKSKCRLGPYVRARRIFVFVACSMTNYSLKEIGHTLGDKDHTTIIHHRDIARGYLKIKDARFMQDYEQYASQSSIWKDYLSE